MMYQNSSGSKAQLLQRINEVSFAVNDILLYLDTHPCCEKGMALYREIGRASCRERVYVLV